MKKSQSRLTRTAPIVFDFKGAVRGSADGKKGGAPDPDPGTRRQVFFMRIKNPVPTHHALTRVSMRVANGY